MKVLLRKAIESSKIGLEKKEVRTCFRTVAHFGGGKYLNIKGSSIYEIDFFIHKLSIYKEYNATVIGEEFGVTCRELY
eukprot:snap_masked-scaffold_7-processed-gene-3.53-mRNA-1 protein AED:1.00 eAED:1.00 QI:0/0/0/0/1/1/2/0/77